MMSKDYVSNDIRLERIYVLILASIQFCHIVDFVIMMPLGPVFMSEFSISPIQFGSLVSSYNLSAAVTGLLYGFIADRFDRKSTLLINFVGFILGTLMCSFANSFSTLLIARVVAGGFGGTLTAVVYAMVTDLIPFQRRGSAMAFIMSAFSLASVVGVPFGLWISEHYSWKETFMFIVIISIFSLVGSALVFPKLDQHIRHTKFISVFGRMWNLVKNKNYLKTYGLVLINVFAIFSLIPYLSPYAVKNIGVEVNQLKFMYLVGGAFTIISARVIGKLTDRLNAKIVFISLAVLSTIPMYLYTHAGMMAFPLFLCMSSLFMMLVSGRMIPLMTMASEISKPEDRGTYMGLLNSVRSFGSAIATFSTGAILVEIDNKLVGFDKVGMMSITISLILIFLFRHVYKMIEGEKA